MCELASRCCSAQGQGPGKPVSPLAVFPSEDREVLPGSGLLYSSGGGGARREVAVMCVCVSICVSVCMYVSLCLCVYVSTCVYVFV